jgi:hypothetical protein
MVTPAEARAVREAFVRLGITAQAHTDTLRALGRSNKELERALGGSDSSLRVFGLFDADGDGLLSFAEYMFFCALLSST